MNRLKLLKLTGVLLSILAIQNVYCMEESIWINEKTALFPEINGHQQEYLLRILDTDTRSEKYKKYEEYFKRNANRSWKNIYSCWEFKPDYLESDYETKRRKFEKKIIQALATNKVSLRRKRLEKTLGIIQPDIAPSFYEPKKKDLDIYDRELERKVNRTSDCLVAYMAYQDQQQEKVDNK